MNLLLQTVPVPMPTDATWSPVNVIVVATAIAGLITSIILAWRSNTRATVAETKADAAEKKAVSTEIETRKDIRSLNEQVTVAAKSTPTTPEKPGIQ